MNELVARGGVTSDKTSVDATLPAAARGKRRVSQANGSAPCPRVMEIRRQYGPSADHRPRVEWTIRNPGVRGQRSEVTGLCLDFVAYSLTWSGARKALIEIEASVERMFGASRVCPRQPITQEAIDYRPRDQRPMGIVRQLLWRASQG